MSIGGKKSSSLTFVLLGVLICLISAIGARAIMTDFGKVEVHEIKIISESGFVLSMDVFKPKNATKENPAPTIFVEHGGNGAKEEMRNYAIELSRRGYVCVSTDMYSMGQSQILPDSLWLTSGRGLYDAVKYIVTLPYVDKNRISLTGFSRGGKAAGEALEEDNKTLNVIKSIFLINSDPIYKNPQGFTDVYGPRQIAALADLYDEFFFTEKADDGSVYSNDANKYMRTLTSPVDYILNSSAQSFLHFGQDPKGLEKRDSGKIYEKDFGDGQKGTRQIISFSQNHQSGHYSPTVMRNMLAFYDRVMPSPVQIPNTNLIYIPFIMFGLAGIIGLFIFAASIILLIIEKTKIFEELKINDPQIIPVNEKSGKIWYWISIVIGIIFSIIMIWMLNKLKIASYHDTIFRSAGPAYFALACLLGGTFNLIMCAVSYRYFMNKESFDFKKAGILIGWRKVLKSALVAFIGVALFYAIVFFAKYMFGTVYFFVLWRFMPFDPIRIPGMLTVLPMFILYYVVSSTAMNCFNYNSVAGKNKWVNNFLNSLFTALPTLCILFYFYGYFKVTGWNPMFGDLASSGSAVFSMPPVVFGMNFFCRKIYEKTGNPYLGGVASGLLAAIMTWTVTEIRIPEIDEAFEIHMQFIIPFVVACIAFVWCLYYINRVITKGTDIDAIQQR
ncbi:hypothetical protein AGMMS49574_26710 [Bacteroidia bacterium]|nr:hypothetical protein AGMMS49574_26710 [Bacteroidia bacterium]